MADLPLLGEPLAIELANTVVAGAGGEIDLLDSDAATNAWVRAHRDALPAGSTEHLPSLERLRRLRDDIRELMAAAMQQRAPAPRAVDDVNAASAAAAPSPTLVWGAGGPPRIDVLTGGRAADAALATIARSAIELLGGPDRERLRQCAREDCVLLFVATNPRRRWCSPNVCGNRARVARHYRRHRPAAD